MTSQKPQKILILTDPGAEIDDENFLRGCFKRVIQTIIGWSYPLDVTLYFLEKVIDKAKAYKSAS